MSQPESTIQLVSDSIERTVAIAAAVGRVTRPGDLIGLIGELGAGKTQFVRGLAEGLGIATQKVSSPTFVFLQEYEADEDDPAAKVLAHIDAYRLEGGADLPSIGWEGYGEELREGAVLAVEWADRIPDAIGPDWLRVGLEHAGDGRIITLTPMGTWVARMGALREHLDPMVEPDKV